MGSLPVRRCSVEGCEKEHVALGLCNMHYARHFRAKRAALRKPQDPKERQAKLDQSFWAKMDKSGPPHPRLGTPCWIWQGAKTRRGDFGYGYGKLGNKVYYAHRRAYALATGTDPGELFVCHKCDVPLCCNPDHLFLGTPKDNTDDAAAKGRLNHARGEDSGTTTLTNDQALEILKLKGVMLHRDIAAKFGVSKQIVSRIHRRLTWGHLDA